MFEKSKIKYLSHFLLHFLEGIYIKRVELYSPEEQKKIDTLEFAKECDIDNIKYFIEKCHMGLLKDEQEMI